MKDAREGKTTIWEKRADDSANQYVKLGARLRAQQQDHVDLYNGLNAFARESARWGGELEVRLQRADKTRLDTVGLDEPQRESVPPAAEAEHPADEDGCVDDGGGDSSEW